MLLYLLRHGEAGRPVSQDRDRQLTPRGEADCAALAGKLAARLQAAGQGRTGDPPAIDKALVSPYVRARQTAEKVAATLGGLQFEESELLTPERDPRELMDYLDSLEDERVLLVGHNPLLSELASRLVDNGPGHSIVMGTAHLVCLSAPQLAPGCASLQFEISS